MASSPGRSFALTEADTIQSVLGDHRAQCRTSDRNLARLALDDDIAGDGTRVVWALDTQVLRGQVLAQGDEPVVPAPRG